jgi:hypothetical protein
MGHITPTEFNQEDVYIVLTALDSPRLNFVKLQVKALHIKAFSYEKQIGKRTFKWDIQTVCDRSEHTQTNKNSP